MPTVTDRVVQTATKLVIEPIFEREFAEHSHGFRPGRSCKGALRGVEELLQSGLVHVVDVDIKGCSDSIPHQRLMELVGERIADGRVLALIESFLKQGIMDQAGEMEPEGRVEGTPQGGSLSPLLANIYLNPLDHLMSRKGVGMVRYADDMVMLCRDAQEARTTLQALREWAVQSTLRVPRLPVLARQDQRAHTPVHPSQKHEENEGDAQAVYAEHQRAEHERDSASAAAQAGGVLQLLQARRRRLTDGDGQMGENAFAQHPAQTRRTPWQGTRT